MITLSQFDLGEILAVIAILVGFIGAVLQGYIPLFYQWGNERLLKKSFGSELFTPEVIQRSTRYYVHPDCSNVDPSREAEIRHVVATTEKLFSVIDKFLARDSVYRHMIILADSGMGKTSALLNYYAKNQRQRRNNRYQIALIPLGIDDADERISEIEGKSDVILFLDAFDEDISAIVDHTERLRNLMFLCADFKRVIMTCRTQFFSGDNEIPSETGIIRIEPRRVGEKGVYIFQKLYLMPLSDRQVAKYLRKRYPLWRWWQRRKAKKVIAQIPNLSVRPMLLSYIPDLIIKQQTITYTYELYDRLVDAWLIRESTFVNPDNLRRFSELLSVDLYTNSEKRGAERIPREQLKPLADQWKIPLDDWQLAGRSLLNRDAEGNFKFAHRSIMEFLFIRCDASSVEVDWNEIVLTDSMEFFIKEMVADRAFKLLRNLPGANLEGANLEGANLEGANLEGANLEHARYNDLTRWPDGFNYQNSGAWGPRANLGGAGLERAHFVGANLVGVHLEQAYLEGANLEGANLRGANLRRIHLRRANLARAHLEEAHLEGAHLEGAHLEGAHLEEAHLEGAHLQRARYNDLTIWPNGFDYRDSGAWGPQANLARANLEKVNLAGTNLVGTNLVGVNLMGANLEGAYLWEAKYDNLTIWPAGFDYQNSGAWGPQANLKGADLEGANLVRANLEEANLKGVNLKGADLEGANLIRANLESAYLGEVALVGIYLMAARYDDLTIWPDGFDYQNSGAWGPQAHLEGANLRGANLEEADLRGVNLRGASLLGANLRGANFHAANLEGASLEGAFLLDADLEGASLEGANLEEANFRGANLQGSNLVGANFEEAAFEEAKYNNLTRWPDGFNPMEMGAKMVISNVD